MRSDKIRVQYVGNEYSTDRPWAVHGGRRAGQTSYLKTKKQAKEEAFTLGKRFGKEVVVENKNGTVSDRRDYRDNSTQQKKQRSGGLFDSFF